MRWRSICLIAGLSAAAPIATHAQEAQEAATSAPEAAPGPADESPQEDSERPRYHRLFPIGAQQAIDRGYDLPRPFGISASWIEANQDLRSDSLAVALGKGEAPPSDALIDVPFVTTDRLKGSTHGPMFRGDVWVFPYLNLFLGFGHVGGTMDIGVRIAIDDLFPPPICGPRNPCEDQLLNFTADVDNATTTIGALTVYGSRRWFVAASIAKTLSISSKERSDVRSTNAGIRGGPRFQIGKDMVFGPYVGANYFDLDTEVEGVVRADGVFPDGDPLALRYRVHLENRAKWLGLLGFNLQLDSWNLQAEYEKGDSGHRAMASLMRRF